MNRFAQIAGAGIAAGAAYLGAQAIDLAITKNKVDDRVLAGRLLPIPRERAYSVGTVFHLINSIVFSAAFRLVVRDRLKGPMWARGLTTAIVETVLAYPAAILEDFHPAVRDGQMDSFQNPTAFMQQIWRHAVFGVVLGWLTPRKG